MRVGGPSQLDYQPGYLTLVIACILAAQIGHFGKSTSLVPVCDPSGSNAVVFYRRSRLCTEYRCNGELVSYENYSDATDVPKIARE